MKLYELTESYRQVLEMAEELDDGSLKDTLDSITEDINIKAENIAKVYKELEADADKLDAEAKRLNARKQTVQNNAKNLKAYLADEMAKVGKDKIKGELFNFTIAKNPPSLDIPDETRIPRKYFIKQEPKLDRKAVLAALKSGQKVRGAEIKQNTSLRIR